MLSRLQQKLNRLVLNSWIDEETNEFYILSPEELLALDSYGRKYYFSELKKRKKFIKEIFPDYVEWYTNVRKSTPKEKDPLEYYAEFNSYSSELLQAMMNDSNVDAVKKSVAARILKERGKIEETKKLQ